MVIKTKQKEEQDGKVTSQSFHTIYVDVDKNAKTVDAIKMSDIADSVEYIPLDRTSSLLVDKNKGLHMSYSIILIRYKGGTYLLNSGGEFQK